MNNDTYSVASKNWGKLWLGAPSLDPQGKKAAGDSDFTDVN